jgi:hypothetical protein
VQAFARRLDSHNFANMVRDFSGSKYLEAWTPRIGPDAARTYLSYRRASSWLRVLALACWPVLWWGVTMGDLTAFIVGLALVASAVLLMIMCGRRHNAAEVAARAYLGLTRRRVPLGDIGQFDRWLERLQWRGLVSARPLADA